MECAITSGKKCRQSAVTLVELMIAMGAGSLVALGLGALTIYTAQSFATLSNYVDLDLYSRSALDAMTREIRQADRVISYSTNQLILTNADTGKLISYTYERDTGYLVRTNGTRRTVLLIGCQWFELSYYQLNTITNTFDQYPASGLNDLKMVQMSWKCSRTMLNRVNTENIQSAKIVIRKQ